MLGRGGGLKYAYIGAIAPYLPTNIVLGTGGGNLHYPLRPFRVHRLATESRGSTYAFMTSCQATFPEFNIELPAPVQCSL
jgi:hypothetical protein